MPYNSTPNNFIINFIISMYHPVSHTNKLPFGGDLYTGIKDLNTIHCFSNNFKFPFNNPPKHFVGLIYFEISLIP